MGERERGLCGWEAKIESFIGVRDNRRRGDGKKEYDKSVKPHSNIYSQQTSCTVSV